MISLLAEASCESILFSCNFDDSNIFEACSGRFTNNINGQKVNVFKQTDTLKSDLKFDLTDITSQRILRLENSFVLRLKFISL